MPPPDQPNEQRGHRLTLVHHPAVPIGYQGVLGRYRQTRREPVITPAFMFAIFMLTLGQERAGIFVRTKDRYPRGV